MRILSQNGMVDLSYESVGISINHNDRTKIVAYPAGNYNKEFGSWKMAEYSTAEKAQKAMEMLRDKYSTLRMQEVIDMNLNQAVYEKLEKCDKVKYFDATFQFPADDEIEV